MVRKLKPILHHIISHEQSGFLEGHKILDRIVSSHETIHSIMAHKAGGMFLKLDLSKAYDRLNWGYLLEVFKACGFAAG